MGKGNSCDGFDEGKRYNNNPEIEISRYPSNPIAGMLLGYIIFW